MVTQSNGAGLDYLNQLANDPKVNWDKVALANEKWSYDQAGLTPVGAALVSIAMAVVTGPGAASFASGLTTSGVMSAAMAAGMTSLASQAAVALINNKGVLGKTLEQLGSEKSVQNLLLTMVTAGALDQLNSTMGWNQLNAKSTFIDQFQKNLGNNLATDMMNSALAGKPFDEKTFANSLQSALTNTGMAQGAFAIGDAKALGDMNAFTAKLAHAALGCAGGRATSGNCAAGAVGALAGELAAQYINPNADPALAEKTIAFAKTIAAVTGVLVGGGGDNAAAVNAAANAGANAAENNWLGDHQKAAMTKELRTAKTLAEQLQIQGKYFAISGKQDLLTVTGLGVGLAEAGWSDVKGLAEFLKDPAAGLNGLKQIINDPQTRQAMGDTIFAALDQKFASMQNALTTGGDDAAIQLGKDLGSLIWQVGSVATGVGGAAKGSAALAAAGVRIATTSLESAAFQLMKLDAGAIKTFKSANEVNALMKSSEWSPAWKPGTAVAETTLKPGTTVKMVVDESSYRRLTTPGADTSRAFGGWATFDEVPSQAYARNQLAITSEIKANVGYVVEVKVTQPINAQVGVVGVQPGAVGGGNQLHFLVPPSQRGGVFEYVVGSGKALQ